MDEIVWIEVLSRRHDVIARHRFIKAPIRIGRGYENDLVLDDPFVAPIHITISVNPTGQLVAEDIGSVNGLFLDHESQKRDRVVLDGNRPLRIGQTLLRVRLGNYAVAPERTIHSSARLWIFAAILAVAIVTLELASLWLRDVAEPKLNRYAMPPLVVILVGVAWTGIWALTSRVFHGQARFNRNLVIALAAILTYSVFDEITKIFAYGLPSYAIDHYAYIGAWCILGVAIALHLRQIGIVRRDAIIGVALALTVLGLSVDGLYRGDVGNSSQARQAHLILLPPALRITPFKDEAAFFADATHLHADVDRDRTEIPRSAPDGDD